ncbi:Rhomboid domain-containing protein 1 [Fukomys damarensis]|uniref:Rhomboid domain-containing protein 1 n=1 Tax=Fukomys damarensis TaxID=885580 RepID=A0A091CQX2_FUKDA|nr:Rhomboid domain-containing protein 1 [Fukomys damarensis]
MQRRSRGINTGLLLLFSQIFQVGINNIPPVTLATLAVNIWFFLNPLKPLYNSCLSVEKCYQQKDWQRLLLSPLHHADDWHLYFNMVSMLWKGINLERRLGSRWFAYILTTFSLLTGVVYLLLQVACAEFMDEPDFRRNCAVGFSGHSGYQNHHPYSSAEYSEEPRNYDVYTAGLSEEEQLERALRASLRDRGESLTPFSHFMAHLMQ